eukprot:59079_1
MATSESTNYDNTNSAIKEEHMDNESFGHESQSVHHDVLHHKLLVQHTDDDKIQNALCPIELLSESANFAAPLIPNKYDPQIFCCFQNVSSNHYKASTPRTSSRKRKNDNRHHRGNPNKKRKKLHSKKSHKYDEDDDLLHTNNGLTNEDLFSYQPHLNVNSRPKRARKKVSYKEPDSNAIPVHFVQPKSKAKPKAKAVAKDTKQAASSKAIDAQPIPRTESVVDNRWVQCDKCLKWRRIPTYVSDKELEGEWSCAMNKWDFKRNSCEKEEEPYDLTEEQTMKVSNGSNSTQKDKRNEFYHKLKIFYATEEIAAKRLDIRQLEMAKIGHKTVDFLQLYLEVTKRGGYHYCANTNLWNEVFVSLSCCQSEFTQQANLSLPNLYFVYLMDYERRHFVASKEGSNQPFVVQQAMDNGANISNNNGDHYQQPKLQSNF